MTRRFEIISFQTIYYPEYAAHETQLLRDYKNRQWFSLERETKEIFLQK